MKRSYFIEDSPVAKGRPRFSADWARHTVRTFSPKKNVAFKKFVQLSLIPQKPDFMVGDIELSISFFIPRPKSHYSCSIKTPDNILHRAPTRHTYKPDLDNLIKAIKDALTGICYKDDCQIDRYGFMDKRWARHGSIEICIEGKRGVPT